MWNKNCYPVDDAEVLQPPPGLDGVAPATPIPKDPVHGRSVQNTRLHEDYFQQQLLKACIQDLFVAAERMGVSTLPRGRVFLKLGFERPGATAAVFKQLIRDVLAVSYIFVFLYVHKLPPLPKLDAVPHLLQISGNDDGHCYLDLVMSWLTFDDETQQTNNTKRAHVFVLFGKEAERGTKHITANVSQLDDLNKVHFQQQVMTTTTTMMMMMGMMRMMMVMMMKKICCST